MPLLVSLKDVNLSIGKMIGWLYAGILKINRVRIKKCRSLELRLFSISKQIETAPK
jgi:hypothetical protein